MNIRVAAAADYPDMHRLRMRVRENMLRDPASVTVADYERIVAGGGRAWVCEVHGCIAGFAVADWKRANVWALFVDPARERGGIGRLLHDAMMEWFFSAGARCVGLTTDAGTRAQRFYEAAGWQSAGVHPNGEVRYELTRKRWVACRAYHCTIKESGTR